MWRQTLRVLPTFRSSHVKIQYGQIMTQIQSKQQLQHLPDVAQTSDGLEKHETKSDENDGILKKIELVPPNLQRYLFPNVMSNEEFEEISDELLAKIELPELSSTVEKNGLMSHFDEIGQKQFEEYEKLLLKALEINPPPKMPKEWKFQVGWTKYNSETGETEQVEYPNENVLFFDVEVCVTESPLACLAIAMSPTSWYSWCSDRLVNDSPVPKLTKLEHLIPLDGGSMKPKIIIGHNVGFDRARVREQYFPEKTGTRFWDTMSMNIAIYGMADHQRKLYDQSDVTSNTKNESWINAWRSRVCTNSLGAIHAKLCGISTKLELNKSMQDVFVKENIQKIRELFQNLTTYCAEDVQATYEIYQKLYPTFRERFPHSITSVGMMEMASAFLPITENWRLFYEQCNEETTERNNKASRNIVKATKKVLEEYENGNYEHDPWLWIADWKNNTKLKKPKWYLNLFSTKEKSLLNIEEIQSGDVKLKCRDVPRIFGLCYGPFPLHYKQEYGWGYLVPTKRYNDLKDEYEMVKVKRGEIIKMPIKEIVDLVEKNRSEAISEPPLPNNPTTKIGIFDFYRLPHPTNQGSSVGSPFSKDFLPDFEQDILWATRYKDELMTYLVTLKETRFWGNYKDRFQEEITVWLDDENKIGAIAPAIIPSGTITRRATHKLWLTSTSPKEGMIGTSLKTMVQCTNGWKLVGADVDSQEQWLAALLGDYVYGKGKAGSTEFSNMLLAGNKSDNSDLHSIVAKQVGISRNHAKVLNYARLYGAGKKHAIEFLKQQAIDENQATNYAEKLFTTTKGQDRAYYELNPELKSDFEEFLKIECPKKYSNQHIFNDGKIFLPVYTHTDGQQSLCFENWMKKRWKRENLPITDHVLFLVKLYPNFPNTFLLFKDGFESHTFNFLEIKAQEKSPSTPILGCRLSQALEALPDDVPGAEEFRKKYKRTVINWVIQSTAVDFLHMLLVCMKWLCEKYDIKARFVLSIHDEIRYLVAEEDQYRAALALNLSNMYVRAAISQKLGINQLPKSIAFFSQVDIDTVLRKEVDQTCKTPDGKIVPPGIALDLKQIVMKTNGSLMKK